MSKTTIAGGTAIEWADFTFNPWWGCERVSPACAHCYADDWAERWGFKLWGADHAFRFFGDKHWDEPLKWARTAPERLGRRPRVFCASMADVFEERPELDEPRERLFRLICATPGLDWLLLTKRPEFARDFFSEYGVSHRNMRLTVPNIWMGVSIENSRFTWRADILREIPAAVRFISAEPLLGSLYPSEDTWSSPSITDKRADSSPSATRSTRLSDSSLSEARTTGSHLTKSETATGSSETPSSPSCSSPTESATSHPGDRGRAPLDLTGIDWVIVGGESGPGARPFHLEHAREIIEASDDRCGCTAFGDVHRLADCGSGSPTAVFVKQLGAKPVDGRSHRVADPRAGAWEFTVPLNLRDKKGGDLSEWPADLRIREFPRSAA